MVNSKNINFLILSLLPLSVVVSDWMIGLVAISEIILAFLLLIIVISNFNYIKTINYKIITGIILYLILQFGYNLSVDMQFVFRRALFNAVKLLFYAVLINVLFNYIKNNKLEKKLLKIVNVFAIIVIIIGIYITLSILYSENTYYELFWRFTRTDLASYRFRGPGFVVRTRSIFSEPAHLGYFLNIILSFNLFTRFKKKIPLWINGILLFGIIITFSYASILVSMLILFIKIILMKNKMEFILNNRIKIFVIVLLISLILFVFRDYIYQTIIIRTTDIISGGDHSAFTRLVNSWLYIEPETILFGRGLGHTPPLQNIYAYFLSDLGLFPFISSILFTIYIIRKNTGIGLSFILLNFQKGGYLSPMFSLFILLILIYTHNNKKHHLIYELSEKGKVV